jgi:YYY domain-containing protein
LFGVEQLYVFIWWLIMQALGWVVLPVSMRLLRWLPDRGYAFSKSIGLLLVSFVLWIGASSGFLRNDLGSIILSILILAALSAWVAQRWGGRSLGQELGDLRTFIRQHRAMIVTVEVLFALAFIAWAVLRAYATFKINETGGEKFMEIAFLNAILRSPKFPPLDPWLSGFAISYYYFGYVMMALMTRLSGVPAGVGFDLYDALLFALTAVGSFGVVYNLIAANLRRKAGNVAGGAGTSQSLSFGLLGALLVTFMGNLEGLLEALHSRGLLSQTFWEWVAIPNLASAPVSGSFYPGGNNWLWWWRASRVLNDLDLNGTPVGAQSITEFPFFSFLLGDNHPHVLALPFVLLGIALAFNLLLRQIGQARIRLDSVQESGEDLVDVRPGRPAWWNPVGLSLGGDWYLFLLYAVALGALAFLNTWDFPIYLGLTLLAYLLGEILRERQFDRALIVRGIVLGVAWLVTAILIYIFFYISFSSQASGVVPYVFPPTRLPQYLVIFGVFIFILGWFLVAYARTQSRRGAAVWSLSLRGWLGVMLVTLGVFALVLLVAALSDVGRQLLGGAVANPLLQAALGGRTLSEALRTALGYRLRDPWLFLLLSALISLVVANGIARLRQADEEQPDSDLQPSIFSAVDYFVFLLIFTGLCLTLSTEFLYLRDSFGVRMNTVFKFYYQAWVMLGCASAYAAWWLTRRAAGVLSSLSRNAFTAFATLLILGGMVYTFLSIYSRVEGFRSPPNLDGASAVARSHPDDWAAIQWLQANVTGSPVILEAPGKSYNYEGRISAFTGLPAVLGWALHEGQWRGTYTEQGLRETDIRTIYTTNDTSLALELLQKYDVRYIILGSPEIVYIEQQCTQGGVSCNPGSALRKFEILFEPVFNSGQVTIYSVP